MDKRRFQGDFFTPLAFAKLGLDYIEKVLGPNWYKEYKIWDMACGTGNLEYHIPTYDNVYMSTIDTGEVMHMNQSNMFPGATVFQYDYLNDDVDLVMSGSDLLDDKVGWKLPRKLREALADKSNKWVVLMNPPYAEAGGLKLNGNTRKRGISESKIKSYMHKVNLGKAGNELFIQFLFRIYKELPTAIVGMYATLKYVNAQSFETFRRDIFHSGYETGFIFPCTSFQGTKGEWPVSFLVWNFEKSLNLETQNIMVDVYEAMNIKKIGTKKIVVTSETQGLNNWFERPSNNVPAIPLKGALSVSTTNVSLTKLSTDALGYLGCFRNDVKQAQGLFMLSSCFGDGHGYSVTPKLLDKTFILWAVMKIVEHSWINDRDQFRQPTTALPDDFVTDCAVWDLFHGSNQTSSLKDVVYKGKTYQVRNQFFPYLLSEVRGWDTPHDLSGQLRIAQDTFVANWLKGRTLSPEAQALLDAGRKVYQIFYKEWKNLNLRKFKIDYWDCGWYQIRNALLDANLGLGELNAVKEAHTNLANKLRPKVYEYGFLDQEILYT